MYFSLVVAIALLNSKFGTGSSSQIYGVHIRLAPNTNILNATKASTLPLKCTMQSNVTHNKLTKLSRFPPTNVSLAQEVLHIKSIIYFIAW